MENLARNIPNLYNIVLRQCDECVTKQCEDVSKQCICISVKQVQMLCALFEKKTILDYIGGSEKLLIKGNYEKIDELLCDVNNIIGEELYKSYCGIGVEVIDPKCGEAYENVFKAIPIVYMTNSIEPLVNRDTYLYFCLYHEDYLSFLNSLFDYMLCKVIDLALLEDYHLEKNKTAAEYSLLFSHLEKITLNRENDIELYRDSVHQFFLHYQDDVNLLRLSKCLKVIYNEIGQEENFTHNANWKISYLKKYAIMLKILELNGISIEGFPMISEEVYQNHDVYDPILVEIEKVKNDSEKMRAFLKRLPSYLMQKGEMFI